MTWREFLCIGQKPKPQYRFVEHTGVDGFKTYHTEKYKFGLWGYVSDSCRYKKDEAYTIFERIVKYGKAYHEEVLEER